MGGMGEEDCLRMGAGQEITGGGCWEEEVGWEKRVK